MDELAQIVGTGVDEVLDPTVAILAPLLKKNQATIKEIPLKTFQYGPTDRHQLDVYYPLAPHPSGKTPILFFVYGGSFISGARNLSEKFGLVYASVGAFFARRGILTVIPDYRLVPSVSYPIPIVDVNDAMEWVLQNASDALVSVGSPEDSLQLDKVFLLGHSAGGFNAASLVFNPDILPYASPLRSKIAGAAFFGGPYTLHDVEPGTERGKIYEQYFGSIEEAKKFDIPALLGRYRESEFIKLPDLLLFKAEKEPGHLDAASEALKRFLSEKLGHEQRLIVAKGHNHISPNWVLGIGEGEEWASEFAEWIWNRVE